MWRPVILFLLLSTDVFSVVWSSRVKTSGTGDAECSTALYVLVVVPESSHADLGGIRKLPPPTWAVGKEILPGAQLAVKEINHHSSLLRDCRFELIPVFVPDCDLTTGVVHFVRELTLKKENIFAVVGYFCHNLVRHLSGIVQNRRKPVFSVVHISAVSVMQKEDGRSPRIEHTNSIVSLSKSTAKAAVRLLLELKWKRVAVISNQNLNYINTKRVFLDLAKGGGINVELEMDTISIGYTVQTVLRELRYYGVLVVVFFVPPSEALEILCGAYVNGFNWPDYAWIFMETIYNPTHLMLSKLCPRSTTLIAKALHGAIFLHPQLSNPRKDINLPSGRNYSGFHDAYLKELEQSTSELNTTLKSNLYANVLYDSVWAFALALNGSLDVLKEMNLSLVNLSHLASAKQQVVDVVGDQLSMLTFQGATGLLTFSHNEGSAALQVSIDILQFRSSQYVQIGSYNVTNNHLNLNATVLDKLPSGKLNRVYVLYTDWQAALLVTLVALCFCYTTMSLFLFVCYRNQPEIKATSRALSICLFIGCYVLLTTSMFHTINSSMDAHGRSEFYRAFVCVFDVFLLYIGFDVVFATVIAKTLRIYHIFKTFGKVSRLFTDSKLFFLIFVVVAIRLNLLIAWISFNTPRIVDVEWLATHTVPPVMLVQEECRAENVNLWVALHTGYSLVQMLVMVMLAILTRKIKRQNYKDSKKINSLVASLIITSCYFLTLWTLLRNGAVILSRVTYGVCPMLMAFFCQAFLVSPKVMPSLLRSCKLWFKTSKQT